MLPELSKQSPKSRRTWIVIAKVLVSSVLVYWILHDIEFRDIVDVLQNTNIPLLFAAFALFFLGYGITGLRWQCLMSIHGDKPALVVLIQSFMVGIFFNNLLPSTVGGDISRMYDAWRLGRGKAEAVSVVLVDRFMGVLALLAWAAIAVLITPSIREISAVVIPLTIVLVCAVVLACLIFGRPRVLVTMATRLVSVLPGVLRRTGDKILQAFKSYYSNPHTVAKAFAFSLLLQFNVIVHFWLVAVAMHLDLSLPVMCVIIPCVLMVIMMPISINAIGVREAAFVYVMGLFAISPANGVAFAWIAFMFVILQGLLGGVVFALRRAPGNGVRA